MVQIFIGKTVSIIGLPNNLCYLISEKLSFENPEFRNKSIRGESTEGIPERVFYYQYSSEDSLLEVPRGFYKQVTSYLESHSIEYTAFDLTSDVKCTYPQHRLVPRDYQVTPIEEAIKAFDEYPSFILRGQTGSGKTSLALYIALSLGVKTLWLTDRDSLFTQCKERVKEYLCIPEEDIGEIVAETWKIGPQITIGMLQTLGNRDLSSIEHEFGLVVLDECILASTKRCYKVLTSLAPKRTLGLSAFIERGDGLTDAVKASIGPIVVDVPESGVIYPLVIQRPTGRFFFFDKVKHRKLPFLFDRKIYSDKQRNELIINDIGLHHDKFTTIVLSKSVKHLEFLKSEVVKRFGAKATITHADVSLLPKKERERNEEAFLKGEYDIMFATYGMLATGYDYPKLDRLIWASPFSSENWAYQSLGRPSRKHPTKRGAIVLDYVDDGEKLAFQTNIRENICRIKGLEIVRRFGRNYLTNADTNLLFQIDDSKR